MVLNWKLLAFFLPAAIVEAGFYFLMNEFVHRRVCQQISECQRVENKKKNQSVKFCDNNKNLKKMKNNKIVINTYIGKCQY